MSSSAAAPADSEQSQYAKASTPSRAAVTSSGKKGKKGGKGDKEKPDFISPEPKNAAERRDWDRMSTRMEGFHSYVSPTVLRGAWAGSSADGARTRPQFRTTFQQSAFHSGYSSKYPWY